MNNSINDQNEIFRDAVLGVILLIAAITGIIAGPLLVHSSQLVLITINSILLVGGAFFLNSAFKKDKYRPQIA